VKRSKFTEQQIAFALQQVPNQVWALDWMHDELFDGRRGSNCRGYMEPAVPGHARVSLGDCHGGDRCA
jgi:hypothetical protein